MARRAPEAVPAARGLLCLIALVAATTAVRAQDSPLPLEARQVRIGDRAIHYRVGGSGPPLLFIHGFALGGAEWDRFLPDFLPHYTVIVPDLPGHGRSTMPDAPWSYSQTARDMFAVLDAEGASVAAVVGHSAGANTILHMASQQPTRLSSMVLIAGGHRLTTETREALRTFPTYEQVSKAEQERLLQLHPGGVPQIRQIYRLLRGLADDYEDFNFSPEYLTTLNVRALLVWGDRDPYYPMDGALELYEALPDASLWVLPGEGHLFVSSPAFGGSEAAYAVLPAALLTFLSGGDVLPAGVAQADDVADVRAAEIAFNAAQNTGSIAGMARYFLPGRTIFGPGGGSLVVGWTEDGLAQRQAAFDAGRKIDYRIESLDVRLYGDAAVSTFERVGTVTEVGGEPRESHLRITGVWVKVDGQWRLAHRHESPY